MLKKLTKKNVNVKKVLNERAAQATLCYVHCKTECDVTGMSSSFDYDLLNNGY